MLLAVSALILAGQAVRFDTRMRPQFTAVQIGRTSEATRDGLAKFAATEFGRRIIESFAGAEYRITVEEEPVKDGIGLAPEPGIATLVSAHDHARRKSYQLILDPFVFPEMPKGMHPLAEMPASPADVMALAWAGEMLHIWFYAQGISLPHHPRLDFQDDWSTIAAELGMPAVRHDDGEPPFRRAWFRGRRP